MLRQRKVTQREALNRTRAPLSLLSLSPASLIAPLGRLTRGCTPCSRENPMQRRSGAAVFPGEFGVQPTLGGMTWRAMALFIRTAARAQRFASGRNAAGCFRATLMASSPWCAVQRLFFGDFLLAPQKKVTPPPGGTPGNAPG
jgi:hypothetical protein